MMVVFIWQTVEYRENISQKNIERLIKNPTYGAYKLSKKDITHL